MRVAIGLLVLLGGIGLPAVAIADDEIASFSARWPESPMRKPTLTELVHFVAEAVKQNIQTAVEAKRSARRQETRPCADEICRLLNSR